jgi:hypothetical protein
LHDINNCCLVIIKKRKFCRSQGVCSDWEPLCTQGCSSPKSGRNSAYVAIVSSVVKPSRSPMMSPELRNYHMFSNWSAASAWNRYKRPDFDEAHLGCSLTTVSMHVCQDRSLVGHHTASRSSIDR